MSRRCGTDRFVRPGCAITFRVPASNTEIGPPQESGGGIAIALAEPAVDRVHLLSRMKAVLALTLCLMASCAGLRSSSPSSLAGEWRYADNIQGCHYIFNPDGTFKGEVVYHARLISKFTGRWSVDGNTLLYTYVSDALGRIPAGATDRDKLLGVERDFFIIEAADGSKRKYLRIR
jgi:hypothetical protein